MDNSSLKEVKDPSPSGDGLGAPTQSPIVVDTAVSQSATSSVDVTIATAARPALMTQFLVLLKRTWVSYWRDVRYNTSRLVIVCAWHLFLAFVFFDMSRTDFASVQVWR